MWMSFSNAGEASRNENDMLNDERRDEIALRSAPRIADDLINAA
jgi:hypothetical protein